MTPITTLIVYTGAPEAADYDYCTTLETFECAPFEGAKLKTWRKVAIRIGDYQQKYVCDRYRSFPGGCPTLDDPRVYPIGTGRPAPTGY